MIKAPQPFKEPHYSEIDSEMPLKTGKTIYRCPGLRQNRFFCRPLSQGVSEYWTPKRISKWELVWIERVHFQHCRKRKKVTIQRQTCSVLSHHSASTYTVPWPGRFLLSIKHLSEKVQPKCHLPQASLLWAFSAIFKYHNLLIL